MLWMLSFIEEFLFSDGTIDCFFNDINNNVKFEYKKPFIMFRMKKYLFYYDIAWILNRYIYCKNQEKIFLEDYIN